MKDNELKKELLVNYFKALKSSGSDADLLFNIIEDAYSSNAWEDLDYSRIHRMFFFDEVFKDYPPHAIATMTNGKDLDKEYFIHSGFYAPGFKTFNYDEVDKVFPFAKIADAYVDDAETHSDNPVVETILYLDIEQLRDDVLDIIESCCTDDQLVCAFDNYVTECVECGVQIFRMAEDLEDVWLNICNDGFLNALSKLEKDIMLERFSTRDLYWEMDGEEVRSFNHVGESVNWFEYNQGFADEIVLDNENWLNLPQDVREKVDSLLIQKYGL